MKRYIILATLAALVASSPARAATTFEAAVTYCTSYIQQDVMGFGFDAYVIPGTLNLEMFGTDRQRFEFQKCMAQQGLITH
jgi:hypothetical protein